MLSVIYSGDQEKNTTLIHDRATGLDMMKKATIDQKRDKDYVLRAVKLNGNSLYYAHDDLKKDEDIVKNAVIDNGLSLYFADISFRKNKAIVLLAVSNNGLIYKIIDDSLKVDKDVAMAAITSNPNVYKILNDDLKKDIKFIKIAVENNIKIDDIPKSFWYKKEIIEILIKRNRLHNGTIGINLCSSFQTSDWHIKYAPYNIKKDKDLMLKLLELDPYSYKYIDDSLKDDTEILLTVAKNVHVSEDLGLKFEPPMMFSIDRRFDIDDIDSFLKKNTDCNIY